MLNMDESHFKINEEIAAKKYEEAKALYDEKQYAEAVQLISVLALQNYAPAQNSFGYCYANGQGITRDYVKAVEWFSKAAKQGYAKAQNNLGLCYSV